MPNPEPGVKFIAKITVPANEGSIAPVLSFLRETASREGFAGEDLNRLEILADEACSNVIRHAFDPGEESTFDIAFTRRPNQFVISVTDKGLPFDVRAVEEGRKSGFGLKLMRAFADEVRYSNLGQEGKRVDILKFLPSRHVADYLPPSGGAAPAHRPGDLPLELRLMRPDECVGLSRCVYRSYGYSYRSDFIYYPERIKERLESGLMASCVAVTPEGEIEGHLSMTLRYPDDRVAEVGQAVVAPEYRGRSLFTKMKSFLAERARARGLLGFYSEAAAAHPFSQKGNIELGAHETGLLLAYAPETLEIKKIAEGSDKDRPSAVLFYLKLNEGPEREVFPPHHHMTMVSKICERSGLKRKIVARSHRATRIPQRSRMDLKVLKEWGQGFIKIIEPGADLGDKVRFFLREMCTNGLACIFADMPLDNPATARTCATLEALGFFFGGILPEHGSGDTLRLQYLNNIQVDPAKIFTASDFGKELLDYVIRELH